MIDLNGYISEKFCVPQRVLEMVDKAEQDVKSCFKKYEKIAEYNQYKIINAFRNNNVSTRHFNPSTGYGYSDEGREKLNEVYADIFNSEKALVSPLFMSGTHAISTAFFGILRPGDKILSITGKPYDTFYEVIYGENGYGSLKEWGISCAEIALESGNINIESVKQAVANDKKIKMIHIQRSRGYDTRESLSCEKIKAAVSAIKQLNKDIIIFVDNCYGEFTEVTEPSEMGADILAGSLIKNPGGGFAPTGGYILGKSELIELIGHRFTAPGVGNEIGSYNQSYLPFFQGLFMAPHIVAQSLMGATLICRVMEMQGFEVYPHSNDNRYDITQSVVFNNENIMTAFIRGIQKASAVDANVVPYAWDMPGYKDKVIMAAGTFMQGSSIELSADGPIRPPYIAFVQGGLTYAHAKLGAIYSLMNIISIDEHS